MTSADRSTDPADGAATPLEARRHASGRDALSEEWDRHRGDLVRYVGRLLTGDTHAAEDVAQETAVRLWQHPEVLAGEQPITGWLRTVARNIVVDRARRRRARPAEVAWAAGIEAESPDPYESLHAADAVAGMLSELSPRHREVVVEVYIRDRPVGEVAAELGVPIGTVKSRCHTAVHRLRAARCPATSLCA